MNDRKCVRCKSPAKRFRSYMCPQCYATLYGGGGDYNPEEFKHRKCLKCGDTFLSDHKFNRVCLECKKKETWKFAEA